MYRQAFVTSAVLACGAWSCAVAQVALAPAPQSTGPAVAATPVGAPILTPAVVATPVADPASVPAVESAPPCDNCITIPALTPVRIALIGTLGSRISKTGDTFAIQLIDPIMVNGAVVVPAGVMGVGEVIHAKKAGGSGAPGELVLAARYLDVGGQRLKLRSLHFATSGKSKYATIERINMAAAVSAPVLSVVGLFMKGGETDVPTGAIAEAKTAETMPIAPLDSATVGALAATLPPTTVPAAVTTPGSTTALVPPSATQPASQEKGTK